MRHLPIGDTVYVYERCYKCATRFAMDEVIYNHRKASKEAFWCPNGHQQAYVESAEDRARRRAERAEQDNARLRGELMAAERTRQSLEKEAKRLQKRASAGVCPCCNKTVVQMARHMKTKHPAYGREDVIKL